MTRAELTGDGGSIVKASRLFRILQPVIEFLLVAGIVLGLAGFLRDDAAGPVMDWLKAYGPWASLSAFILLAVIVMTVRLAVALQMRKKPLDFETQLAGKKYTVVGTKNPRRVLLLSILSVTLLFLSPLWCIGLTSEYVSRGFMVFLLVLSLVLMVLSLWAARRERMKFIRIMTMDCSGISLFRNTKHPGRLIPWKEISKVTPTDSQVWISRGTDNPDKTIIVSMENSLVRSSTIAKIADHYRLKAVPDC